MSFERKHWFPTAEVCLHVSVSVREESSWTHERAVCKYVVLWLRSVTQTEVVYCVIKKKKQERNSDTSNFLSKWLFYMEIV